MLCVVVVVVGKKKKKKTTTKVSEFEEGNVNFRNIRGFRYWPLQNLKMIWATTVDYERRDDGNFSRVLSRDVF